MAVGTSNLRRHTQTDDERSRDDREYQRRHVGATHDMARAVRFYRMLGFEVVYGGDTAGFTSFRAGRSYLNLVAQPAERRWSWWSG